MKFIIPEDEKVKDVILDMRDCVEVKKLKDFYDLTDKTFYLPKILFSHTKEPSIDEIKFFIKKYGLDRVIEYMQMSYNLGKNEETLAYLIQKIRTFINNIDEVKFVVIKKDVTSAEISCPILNNLDEQVMQLEIKDVPSELGINAKVIELKHKCFAKVLMKILELYPDIEDKPITELTKLIYNRAQNEGFTL